MFFFQPTMPPRRQQNNHNINNGDVHAELNELRQSNQALQEMINELLQQIPTLGNQSQSEGTRRFGYHDDLDFDEHSTTSSAILEPALVNPWPMDRLARALENTNRIIPVKQGSKGNSKGQYLGRNEEQFYQLLSRINLHETDDQLVARYVSGLKYNLKGELMMHSLSSLEESYQMALKTEEKHKWSSYQKPESSKIVKDKNNKVGKGASSSFKCFRCGKAGHRSYECPNKKRRKNQFMTMNQKVLKRSIVAARLSSRPLSESSNWSYSSDSRHGFESNLTKCSVRLINTKESNLANHFESNNAKIGLLCQITKSPPKYFIFGKFRKP
ncbi:hypothetical protein CsSME_00006817 [Camellia sinensis var. sinensis]